MKKGGITPRSIKCGQCGGALYQDEEWYPGSGYDASIRRFEHRSAFKQRACGNITYKRMNYLQGRPTTAEYPLR